MIEQHINLNDNFVYGGRVNFPTECMSITVDKKDIDDHLILLMTTSARLTRASL